MKPGSFRGAPIGVIPGEVVEPFEVESVCTPLTPSANGTSSPARKASPAPPSPQDRGKKLKQPFMELLDQLAAEHNRELKAHRHEVERLQRKLERARSKERNDAGAWSRRVSPGEEQQGDPDLEQGDRSLVASERESPEKVAQISPGASLKRARSLNSGLAVLIEWANGLPNVDYGTKGDLSDPYCVCEVVGKEKLKSTTPVMFNSLQPVWHHACTFKEAAMDDKLRFAIYDKNISGEDKLIAAGTLTDIPEDGFDDELVLNCNHVDPRARPCLKVKVTYAAENSPVSEGHVLKLRSVWLQQNVRFTESRTCSTMEANKLGAGTGYSTDEIRSKPKRVIWLCRPDSTFRVSWDIAGLLFLLFDLIWLPMTVYEPPATLGMSVVSGLALAYWTLDIVLTFNTMVAAKDGAFVVDRRTIAIAYLHSWFILDVTVVLFEWVAILFFLSGSDEPTDALQSAGAVRGTRIARFIKMFRVLRVMRLVKIRKVLFSIQSLIDVEWLTMAFAVGKNLISLLLLNHLLACIFYLVGTYNDTDSERPSLGWVAANDLTKASIGLRYILSINWSLAQFTPGATSIQPGTRYEKSYAVLVLVLGLVVATCFISSITSTMASIWAVNNHHMKQSALLRKFMKQSHLPRQLSSRIVRYVELTRSLRQAHVQEAAVEYLELLSGPLLCELKVHLYEPSMSRHGCFMEISQHCERTMRNLCATVVTSIDFAKNDLIFSLGSEATSMLYVKLGSIAFRCWPDETMVQETKVRDAGIWCVEPVIYVSWEHRGDMKALSAVEMFAVQAKKFAEVVMRSMEAYGIARSQAVAFYKRHQASMATLVDVYDLTEEEDELIRANAYSKEIQSAEAYQARIVEWPDDGLFQRVHV